MKADAFDLKLKAKDYEQIHQQYTALQHRHSTVYGDETRKQDDLRGQLSFMTTNLQSLIREVEELKSIYFEQQDRLRDVSSGIDQHGRLADDRYDFMERQRTELQTKIDECAKIGRDIKLREMECVELK